MKLKTVPFDFECKKCGKKEHFEIIPPPTYSTGILYFDHWCICGLIYENLSIGSKKE